MKRNTMRGRIDDRACHIRLTHVDMVVSKQITEM